MKTPLRSFSLVVLVLCVSTSWAMAQTQVFIEEFNDDSQFTVTQGSIGQDGDDNYFLLNQNASPAIDKSYAEADGNFLTGQDTNDPDVGANPNAPVQIEWTGIDITGQSNLVFNGDFAEVLDGGGDIDESDFLLLEYQIDGGGYQPLIAFEGTGRNTSFLEDTDFDGTGDGRSISSSDGTMTAFPKLIPGTGSTLDLRFTAHVDSGDEDFAIDDFVIFANASIAPTVAFTEEGTTVNEDAGTATLTVEISNPDGNAVDVDVALDAGSSADASDVGNYTTQTVTFPAGASDGDTETVTVSITDDDETEGSEVATFMLEDVSSSGSAEIGATDAFDLSITDNDVSAQIIISQYAEDGNLKGMELLNVSGAEIDFSTQALTINRYANGGTSASEEVTVTSGTLAPGAVIVFADDTNSAWTDAALSFTDVSFQFNGDDAMEVVLDGLTQDVFGTIGQDPGSSWSGNGVDTRDQNLELRSDVTTGDPDGWTDPSTRFRTIDEAPLDNGTDDGGLSGFQDVDGFGEAAPLPVELTMFDVTTSGTAATLVWKTASETNNAGFEVQRAVQTSPRDVSTWESLGFVEGNGTTTQPQTYRFRTDALMPGTHTFRLKQVDTDGTTSLSPERTITVRTDAVLSVQGPNPMRSGQQARLTVQVDAAQSVDVALYNVLGQRVQTVFSGAATPSAPAQATLTTDRLPSGMYFVRVSGETVQATQQITVVR